MTGSTKYSIVWTKKSERTLKQLGKLYKAKSEQQIFKQFVSKQLLKKLRSDPFPTQSRAEPLPSNMTLPEGLAFRKLKFEMQPRRGGASGEGRLMYLVDSEQYRIILIWIYTHKEFSGRPDDKSLKNAIQEGLISLSDETDSLNNN